MLKLSFFVGDRPLGLGYCIGTHRSCQHHSLLQLYCLSKMKRQEEEGDEGVDLSKIVESTKIVWPKYSDKKRWRYIKKVLDAETETLVRDVSILTVLSRVDIFIQSRPTILFSL